MGYQHVNPDSLLLELTLSYFTIIYTSFLHNVFLICILNFLLCTILLKNYGKPKSKVRKISNLEEVTKMPQRIRDDCLE